MRSPAQLRGLREDHRLRGMWRRVCLRLAVLCLVGLVGCALPGTTRPMVKIGLVAPFEGWYRPRGYDALAAVRLAIGEANGRGGVAGHRVELVALDDHLDPHWAAQRAYELVADPAVMGVLGCLSPATAEAAGLVYSTAGLPLITLASVDSGGHGVFVLAPASDALARAAIAHIRSSVSSDQPQRARRVALLYGRDGAGWAETLQGQTEVVASVEVDRQGWLEALIQAHAGWVICTAEARLGGEALQQARDGGLRASFIGGPDWQTDAFHKVAGDALREAWFVTGVPRGEELAGARDFVLAYRELGGHDPGPDGLLAYDAAQIMLAALREGIEQERRPSRQGVERALSEVSLEGVSGRLRFDRQGARRDASVWVYRAD